MLIKRLAGPVLVFFSICAVILSFGAPGLGWALSGITLIAASMCTSLIGRSWLVACTVLTLALLFSFGPLGYFQWSAIRFDAAMALFTFTPLAIAMVALMRPLWRPRS